MMTSQDADGRMDVLANGWMMEGWMDMLVHSYLLPHVSNAHIMQRHVLCLSEHA